MARTTARNGTTPSNAPSARAGVHDRAPGPSLAGVWAADYAPAPETVRTAIAPRHAHYINGAWREPSEGTRFPTINPATEEVLSEVAQGSGRDVDAAVRAARAALPAWSALRPAERAKFIFRIARRIQERSRELAVLESLDSGKPIRESRDVDVPLAAAHFFYHAGWADKLAFAFAGRTPRPVGVCGQIIPWNFPLLMAAWKLAPALACGNTCVLKPAETTPLSALRLAEIIDEIGLPKGVVNVVTGDGTTGAALVEHAGVDKIAFTGSTEVGKRIAASVAGRGTRLTLELGGKSPHIIFEDASIDQAVEGVVRGIYFNQGEVCCAGSRLFVQESILPEVLRTLEVRLASLRVGDPLDKNTDVGAMNSRSHLDRVLGYLRRGTAEGAVLCTPARENGEPARPLTSDALDAWRPAGLSRGFWCPPCFFTGVQPSHTIARDEVFGPVLAVMSFRTPDEAVARANNTPYGLAAGIWTDKGSKVFEIAGKLKAGVVWCNTYNRFDPASPFGGYKESGFGREGGVQGLRAYVRLDEPRRPRGRAT
ncbi:MAG: aldehyde dehydrogenase family protein [Planctomycetota bacterium]|nr:aldehyde dehydrogenase family protein [Planctomycetota bacterium]